MRSERSVRGTRDGNGTAVLMGMFAGALTLADPRAQAYDVEAPSSGALLQYDDHASGPWHVRSLLQDADLVGTEITHIVFDAQGNALLSTNRGLIRYDGINWERRGGGDGLPIGTVRCTQPTASGEIFVALEHGAGVLRDGHYQSLGVLDAYSVRRIHLAADGSAWFCCDRGPDNAFDGGLVRLHGNDVRYFRREQHPSLSAVFDLVFTSEGLRLATADGIVDMIGETFVSTSPQPPGNAVFAFVNGADGSLLASTPTGLHQHDGSSWRTLHSAPQPPLLHTRDGAAFSFGPESSTRFWRIATRGLSPRSADVVRGPTRVDDLTEAPDGALWAVGPDLLVRWGRGDTDLRFHRSHPPPIGEDVADRTWFASGIRVGHRGQAGWRDEPELAEPVCVTAGGDVWARTADGAALLRIRGEERHRHTLELPARLRLFAGRQDLLALGLESTGTLTARLLAGGSWHHWRLPADLRPALDEVDVADDPDDGFWLLVPIEGGARLFRAGSAGLQPAPLPDSNWRRPLDFAVGADGRRWLVAGGTAWTQEPASEAWRMVDNAGAKAVWITLLDGRVALGSRRTSGMFGLALEVARGWLDCPMPSGRPFHPAGAALICGSGGRLFRIPADGTPQALPMPPVTDVISTLVTRAGEIWVGTTDGAFHLRPDPRLHVVQLTTPRVLSAEGETVWLPVSVRSPFRPRAATASQSFSYRVRVGDDAWSRAAPLLEEIALTALPAGRHVVDVEVRDVFGRVSKAPARATVEVRPVALQARPWFPWALGGVAVALTTLLGHALVSRRQLRRRAHRLGEVIENRTRKIRVELQRRIEVEGRLRVRNRVLTQLATGKPLDDAMATIVRDLEAEAQGWWCAVCTLGPRRELVFLAAPSLPTTFKLALGGRPAQPGSDPCCDALDRAKFWVEPRLADRTWSAEFEQLRTTMPLGASCSQPILSSYNEALGAICLFASEPASPTPVVIDALESAARMATLAIELRRGEQERRQLQAQMQEAQRLESLGLLAGGIAHDFNNLLTGILGHTGVARAAAAAHEPYEQTLAQVELAAQRAASLCSQLLAYSGRGRFVVRPIDLSQLVCEMTQMLRLSIAGKHELVLDLPDGLPAIEGDATQIGQVVMNLLTNAREAIGDLPGAISIRTEVVDLTAEHLRHCVIGNHCEPGRYVSLEVRDTGTGMSESTLRSIFDPFFTTKFTGRGLGLAAVHGIVRGHAGAMEISSSLGAGSRFRMFLPASSKTVSLPAAIPAVPDMSEAGVVLVVDDEMCVRDVTQTVLESAGFEVVGAADGPQALAIFAARRCEIRLVLLDLILPKMSGEEVLGHIRALDAALPVILSSGFDDTDVAEHMAHDTRTQFLKKPYGPNELLLAVRAALGVANGAAAKGQGGGP